jgi:hypothetical protein
MHAHLPHDSLRVTILRELWDYLREHKKLWLLPLVLILVSLGALVAVVQGSALAPFIYSIF